MGPFGKKRLTLVSGKGGVGKSAIAAALALGHAQAGHRTLICEINAEEKITRLLDRPAVGAQVKQVEDNLWAVDIRPEEAMREYALMVLRLKALYRAVFENTWVRKFLRFIPSLAELVMIGKVLYHLEEKGPKGRRKYDRVVVDAPATGHAISFFSVPQVLLETVPAGVLLSEAERMRALLIDPDVTGAVLVTLPEELPLNETVELSNALKERVGIGVDAVVLNGYVPGRFSPQDIDRLASRPRAQALAAEHAFRARASADAEARLRKEVGRPVLRVPRLYQERHGREATLRIAASLFDPEVE